MRDEGVSRESEGGGEGVAKGGGMGESLRMQTMPGGWARPAADGLYRVTERLRWVHVECTAGWSVLPSRWRRVDTGQRMLGGLVRGSVARTRRDREVRAAKQSVAGASLSQEALRRRGSGESMEARLAAVRCSPLQPSFAVNVPFGIYARVEEGVALEVWVQQQRAADAPPDAAPADALTKAVFDELEEDPRFQARPPRIPKTRPAVMC